MWHDHSSLASHGIISVMVDVVYNPVLFLSESESPGVQEFIEEALKKRRSISLLMDAPPQQTKPASSQKDWQSWKDSMNLCLLQEENMSSTP